ncbi:MAG: TetR/AcrR family transcriptional regulator [Acidimicrobiales bacterium]
MSTKERILDAALELFAEDGVAGTTVTAIERRAGLSGGSGSLYRHFRSKEDVLDATLQREIARLKAELERDRGALPRLPDRRSQLTLEFHQCLRDVERCDRLMRIMQRDPERAAALPGTLARVFGLDRGVSGWSERERTADPGGLDPLSSMIVAAALMGYRTFSSLQRGAFRDIDADRFIERLVDLVEETGKEVVA